MRTYLKTHKWITFEINLERIPHTLWMSLGEAQSKCEHLAGTPLQPEIQDRMHSLYLAKGVHATTAIEGNTLTEDQVMDRISGKLELPASQEYLAREVDNILFGCNAIKNDLMIGGVGDLTTEEIKRFNALVLNNLSLGENVSPGEIRGHSVGVGRYRGAPPEDCEYLLDRLCTWLNQKELQPSEGFIAFGIIRAVLAHLYLAWIHPFGDGNGRTARLLEFKILLSHGIPSAAAHLLSNHYNLTRSEYYRQLDRSSKTMDPVQFISYAVSGFVDGLKEQLKLIKSQQLSITWRDFVYDKFRFLKGATSDRRRNLILDLSKIQEPVQFKDIKHITPRMAEAYAGKTEKAIQRDINILLDMGLLKKDGKGYRAFREKMRAFLPDRVSI